MDLDSDLPESGLEPISELSLVSTLLETVVLALVGLDPAEDFDVADPILGPDT